MRPTLGALSWSVVLVAMFCAACAGSADSTATSTTAPPSTVVASSAPPSSVAPSSVAPSTEAPEPPEPGVSAATLCAFEMTLVLGQVENPDLVEASGLAASRRHPGVIWTHNDGGEQPGVFALATDGSDLGVHPLVVDGVIDVEDMALVTGRDGDDILLADIGDNGADRPSIRVYRFAEPDPATPGPITEFEVLEFTYPDRAHNAETLLVDERNDRIVIVTKEQRRVDGVPADLRPTDTSFVFEGPLAGHGAEPIELTAAGTVDTRQLEALTVAATPHPASLLGLGGLPTGGDVSPDGSLVAIRTYETIWVWDRAPGESVAEALATSPCQAPIALERQGEAVTFLDGSLVTLGEGDGQSLFRLAP